jgi:hypothetical protein
VKYFTYLGSLINNDAQRVWKNVRDYHGESDIEKSVSLRLQIGHKFKEATCKGLLWTIYLCGAETWTVGKVNHEYLECFGSVLLEKDGEDQLDRSCEK